MWLVEEVVGLVQGRRSWGGWRGAPMRNGRSRREARAPPASGTRAAIERDAGHSRLRFHCDYTKDFFCRLPTAPRPPTAQLCCAARPLPREFPDPTLPMHTTLRPSSDRLLPPLAQVTTTSAHGVLKKRSHKWTPPRSVPPLGCTTLGSAPPASARLRPASRLSSVSRLSPVSQSRSLTARFKFPV